MSRVIVLGPQRERPNVAAAVDSIAPRGPVAAITAGWQEREPEDDELRQHLGRELVNLRAYERSEHVFSHDPALFQALRAFQDELKRLQRLYRIRLTRALQSARELLQPRRGGAMLETHRAAAIRAVRTIDRQHGVFLRRMHDEFEERWRPGGRPHVARQRERIEQALAAAGVVAVAGGHVAVLLNRMRLLVPAERLAALPVVAWSAGAMALAERVVLFHDHPPQGGGSAEVLDVGVGVVRAMVPLPHARVRLDLEDGVRVALFARRFAPDLCAVLEAGSRLEWDGRAWRAEGGAVHLAADGRLAELGPA